MRVLAVVAALGAVAVTALGACGGHSGATDGGPGSDGNGSGTDASDASDSGGSDSGGSDAGSDAGAGMDAMVDAPRDAMVDAPRDAMVDAPRDAMVDAPRDAMVDAPRDAMVDAPRDAMVDAPRDAMVDAPRDAMVDAKPDAASDANGRGLVTVHLVDKNALPLAGLHVVFIDTDTTVTDLVSDAAGYAAANVYPGASVTAVRARDTGGAYSLTTVLAVTPGDDLTLVSANGAVSSAEDPFTQGTYPLPSADIATSPVGATKSGTVGTYTTVAPHGFAAGNTVVVAGVGLAGYNGTWTIASVPSTTTFTVNLGGGGLADSGGGTAVKVDRFTITYAAYAGAASYTVYTPCGPTDVGASLSPQVLLRAGCSTPTMDLLVVARNAGGAVLAWAQQTGVAFTPGGNTTITDPWHAPGTITASYTNPTVHVTDIELDRFAPYVRGPAAASALGTTSGGTTTLMVTAPLPARGVMKTLLSCPDGANVNCIQAPSGVSLQTMTSVVDGTATSYALDIGASLLPWLSTAYSPTTTTLQVSVTGAGAIDLFEGNLRYTRGSVIYVWRVFGPTPGDVVFPTLPASLPGDPTVRTTDVQSNFNAYACESDAIAGYRDAVKNVYSSIGTCTASSSTVLRPFGGTINRLSASH